MAQIVLALFAAIAFTMNFVPYEEASMNLQTVYDELVNGFGGTAFKTTVLWGLFCFAAKKMTGIKKNKNKPADLLAVILAVIWGMGRSFQIDDTLNALYCSWVQMIKTMIYVIGMSWFLAQTAYLCEFLLSEGAGWRAGGRLVERWQKLHQKHAFMTDWAFVSLGALPQLIACYPAGMSYDARLSLLYYFDLVPFTSHHPPFSTWVMGKTVSLGLLLGSANLGIFFYCILQYILFCLVMAYLIHVMRTRLQAPEWLQIFTLAVAVIAPYHAAYVGVMIKDVIYAYMIVWIVIESIYFLGSGNFNQAHYILAGVASVIAVLYRYNGKYVVYPALLVLAAAALCRKNRQRAIRLLLVTVGVVLISTSAEAYFMHHYVEEKENIREALSLPFQQTARYVKQYGDEVTKQEEEAIDGVLDYGTLAEIYNPALSDPVKATFRSSAAKEDLRLYFRTWFRQFLKHPWCYVEATVNQNYYLVFPMAELHSYFSAVIYDEPLFEMMEDHLGVHEVDSPLFQALSSLQALYAGGLLLLPGVGMLSNIGAYNILLLYVMTFALHKRCYRTLALSVPLVCSDIVVIAAPCVSPRYLFPVLYSMPCVIALYMAESRQKAIENAEAWKEDKQIEQ